MDAEAGFGEATASFVNDMGHYWSVPFSVKLRVSPEVWRTGKVTFEVPACPLDADYADYCSGSPVTVARAGAADAHGGADGSFPRYDTFGQPLSVLWIVDADKREDTLAQLNGLGIRSEYSTRPILAFGTSLADSDGQLEISFIGDEVGGDGGLLLLALTAGRVDLLIYDARSVPEDTAGTFAQYASTPFFSQHHVVMLNGMTDPVSLGAPIRENMGGWDKLDLLYTAGDPVQAESLLGLAMSLSEGKAMHDRASRPEKWGAVLESMPTSVLLQGGVNDYEAPSEPVHHTPGF